MRCALRAITYVIILAASGACGSAQLSEAPSAQPALAEADLLNALVVKLYRDGKFSEGLALAERALALREKTLGPSHPDVSLSLNNLAGLYQAQGAYAQAEPLFARALAIVEKVRGPSHPDVAFSLNSLAELYRAQGAYAEAEPLHTRALAIREKALGPSHPRVAQSLNNLAALYWSQGAYARAQPLLTRALAINEKALGPSHPDVANDLNSLAEIYRAQGEYAKAEPLYTRVLAIRGKALGPSHPDVANSLNSLAELYRAQGEYAKAEPLYTRALAVLEKALGSSHPDVATCLNNHALLYKAQGAYAEAEPLLIRVLTIYEKALGPNHSYVASSLDNLAMLYKDQGAYAEAEPLLIRALAIREKALGPGHPDVATDLNNLAGLYRAQGEHAKAEPLYTRALAILEKALGPSHPDVATSLNNLTLLYKDQGAYAKSEPLLTRALAILEKALGPSHPRVAASLNNLAVLYWSQGEYAKAEPLLTRALAILEKALGSSHPDVAAGLDNLALLYEAQGAYAKSEPLLIRALTIFEKALGSSHPDVAISLNNFAGLYQAKGEYAKAEPLYTRALAIDEKALGLNHPSVASTLINLAATYRAQGAYAQAEPLVARAADIREQQLRTELVRLSESRKRALMTLLQVETESVVSLHADAMPSSTSALELALTTVLRRKGRIVDSMVDSDTRIRSHLTPQLRDQLDQLAEARSELVAQLYAPAGSRVHAAVAATRARIDELDSALSKASAEIRTQTEPVTLAKIQAAVPVGAALVELVRYRRNDPRQPKQRRWQAQRYLAYLLTARGPPQWVALGEAAPIDAQIDAALAAIYSKAPSETMRAELQRLDALVLAPIRARLSGVSHLIVAPDGKLNMVPFEALVDPQGRYALENYLISYVTTGRDLMRVATPRAPRSPAVIVAGPDYGPLPKVRRPGTLAITPLPGALAEATDLQRYFAAAPLTGGKATKSALAALRGPAMLHIATHGFYARSPGLSPVSTTESTQAGADTLAQFDSLRDMFVDSGGSLSTPPVRPDDLSDALDRSGLAMAGANLGPGGIVTAREIAGLDWWGTQLVVLSACETGVGAVASGDGVYGLRRALVLAGAASQVVSLWSVSDNATRALMRDYYGHLARGIGRAEALRQAKRDLMDQPRYAHPYYWAAFIPAGDWRPLDKTVFASPAHK